MTPYELLHVLGVSVVALFLNLSGCQTQSTSGVESARNELPASQPPAADQPRTSEGAGAALGWTPASEEVRQAISLGTTANLQLRVAMSALADGFQAYEWHEGRLPTSLAELESGAFMLFLPADSLGNAISYAELPSHRSDAPEHSAAAILDGEWATLELGAGIMDRQSSQGIATSLTPAQRIGISATQNADQFRYQHFRAMLTDMLSLSVQLTGTQPASWDAVVDQLGVAFVEHPVSSMEQSWEVVVEQDASRDCYRLSTLWAGSETKPTYWLIEPDAQTGQVGFRQVLQEGLDRPFVGTHFATFRAPLLTP